jgi:cadmium resistance protein CadD (predicted permease)
MNSMLVAITAGVTTFAVTSIDDLILLTLFFAHRIPTRKIVAGQYLGFGAIIAVTLITIVFALSFPHKWVRALGLLPIGVGIKQLIRASKGDKVQQMSRDLGMSRIALLIFSGGADNIGVYLPLFLVSRGYLSAILAVYAFLIMVWCFFAKWLGKHPGVLRQLDRRGHWIMPAVLLALGVYILNS